MAQLSLTFFERFHVALDGEPVTAFPTDKVRALLVYLAVEQQAHQRSALAQFLWPGYSEESANNSLRQTLYRLRQLLQDAKADPPWLIITRQTVQFNPAAPYQADVTTFTRLLAACVSHEHPTLIECQLCLARLQEAVDLYRGDFLGDFTVADSDPFEEWRRITQEQLHLQVIDALTQLGHAAEVAGDVEAALQAAHRQLALEPWLESAHRRMMRVLANRGQWAAAIAQYQRCCQVLAEEFGVEPDAETLALHEQIRSSQEPAPVRSTLTNAGPPLQRADGAPAVMPLHPQPLPIQLTPLLGRAQEVTAIAARLREPDVRLLTIVGAGGMGKTRLAIEVGQTVQETFVDGVCYVELAAVSSATSLASAIATALGIPLQGGEPRDLLLQALRRQQMLLILDNLEHLLGVEATVLDLVSDLLMAAPELRFLITSRERLKLRYEQIYTIPALAFEPVATLSDAADMAAVRLFVQAAQRSQPHFQLTDANVAAVLRICWLVQGMPLGLELAAANINQLPPAAIADALAQSAEVLAVDWRDLPERQRSMRAVFDWSWQLLSAPEQRALCQCAFFLGGFTYNAAQAVTGATLDLLNRLIDKSLLQWQAPTDGEGRYTMHEVVRQFAGEELQASGAHGAIAEQHCRYYLAYLAARGPRLARSEPKAASNEIHTELDNIRQAWQWAATQGYLVELDQATYSWWQFCQFSDFTVEGRASFRAAVEGIRRYLAQLPTGSPTEAGSAARLGQQLLAKLLAIHADYLFAQGCDQEMATQAQEAIELGAAGGGVEGETFGTFVLGRAAQELGQLHEAGDYWRRTLQLVATYQPAHPESELRHEAHWMAHNWLRGNELGFGRYAASRAHMVQALQICQALGKRRGELYCLSDLAWTDFYLFDFATAEPEFQAALALAGALGYRRSNMVVQAGLGEVLRLRGAYTGAQRLLEEAAAVAAELALPYNETHILAFLTRLHCGLGNQTAAAAYSEQLAQILEAFTLPIECHFHHTLAAALKAHYAEDTEEALAFAEEAYQQCKRCEIPFRLVDTALILGHTRAAAGQWAAAAAAFQQALTTIRQFSNQPLAAEAQAGLAQIALSQGDSAGAQAQVEAFLPLLKVQPRAGYNNPFFIYLVGYRVLAANGDPRAAPLLQQGYTLLHEDAATLDDESRRRFLTALPVHRDLIAAYQALQSQADKMADDKMAGKPVTSTGSVTGLLSAVTGLPSAVTGSPIHAHSPLLPRSPSPLLDLGEMPVTDFFTGRAAEVAQLTAWLAPDLLENRSSTNHASARLISVLGLGGIGKTTLAAAVTKAAAPTFAVVIWRSLLNAPPPTELLRDLLQTLARQRLTTFPEAINEQLRLLLDYLRQERCLLVLDNLESLFATEEAPGRAGVMRAGYEGYDQLLERFAAGEHQSTLLITSREQPHALNRWGRQAQAEGGRIRVLGLTGLDPQAGQALLQSNGLTTSPADAASLVENYSGNPLALQIAAATIADFFGGDVAAFRREEGTLFDGMRMVLDQQFARLSRLERDILLWLAIEREAISVPTLRSNFVDPVTTRALLEALQALQSRSLLGKHDAGLALQNVIIEYATEYIIEQIYREMTDDPMTARQVVQRPEEADHPRADTFLNRFFLRKAQAKEYVQQSQTRLLVQPLADRLLAKFGHQPLRQRIRGLLDGLRQGDVHRGYAGGNLCNLLVHLGEDLSGYDFSHLPVWQADLRGLLFAAPNFTGADLTDSTFTVGITTHSLHFQPTGELLVAGLDQTMLCLWHIANGQLLDAFRSVSNGRNPICFSPNGDKIAVAGLDDCIQIWSTADGRCVQTLASPQSTIYALAFHPDGRFLASGGGDGMIRIWDPATAHCQQQLPACEQGVDALCFSPDGRLLASGSGDAVARLWQVDGDTGEYQLIAVLQGHTREIGALAFAPDGLWLASGSHDGVIHLWDLTDQDLRTPRFQDAEKPATQPAVGVNSSKFDGGDNTTTVATRVIAATYTLIGHTSIVRALQFQPLSTPLEASPVTYHLASGSSDQTVRLWEFSTATGTAELTYTLVGHRHELSALSFSPDGQQLASCGHDQQIYLWNVRNGQAFSSVQAYHYGLNSVCVSRDGQLIAAGGEDRIVHVWQRTQAGAVDSVAPAPSSAQLHQMLRGHQRFLRDVALSPSGRIIASSGAEHLIRLWDSQSGQALPPLTGHTGAVLALAFAPQPAATTTSTLLASAGADRAIRFWLIPEAGEQPPYAVRQLQGHEDEILALAFTPDGRQLVSGCMDGSVRIWDATSGALQHQLLGHTTAVTSITVSPDGNTLATISFDYTIRLWDVASGRCLHVEKEGHVGPMSVAFGQRPDTKETILAYGGNDFGIYLWPWQRGVAPIPLHGHTGHVTRIAFSATDPFLVSCSHDNTVRLWDLATYQCRQVLQPLGPYAGMQIASVKGISEAQKAALHALGAVGG